MKRAKIMLTVIAVLATVGGALAFKAQKVGSSKYCYLTTEAIPAVGKCTATITSASAVQPGAGDVIVYYTTTQNINLCTLASCEFPAKETFND